MAGMSSEERRMRRVEEELAAIRLLVQNMGHKVGQVAEDSSRDAKPLQNTGAVQHFFAQASGDIGAASGGDLGTGSANILQVIGSTRYQLPTEKTVDVFQSTGGIIDDLTFLELIYSKGRYSVIVADCVTIGPEKAASPPEE